MWNFNKMYKNACGDRDEFMIREFASEPLERVARSFVSMETTLVVNLAVRVEIKNGQLYDCKLGRQWCRRGEDVMYSQRNVLHGPPTRPSRACISLSIAHVNAITNSVRATDKDEENAL
jgi:hypothetical protein